jgi:hypothetical protein
MKAVTSKTEDNTKTDIKEILYDSGFILFGVLWY